MKRIFAILLIFVFFYLSMISAYSLDIDGYDRGVEWADAETTLLLNGESNCKVNFGLLKWCIEPKTNSIYFCVMFKEPELPKDNANVGAAIKIDNSEFYTVNISSSPNQVNEDRYSFEGAVSVDDNNGVTCEIRIGLKYGLPDIINGSVRFIDSDGVPSNIYSFTIDNTEEVTEEYKNYHTETSNSTTPVKTTTQKPKKTTTKPEKTTKTTTSNSNDFWLLDMILYNLSTTKAETSAAASKTKSETKNKTKKAIKTTVKKEQTSTTEIMSESIQQSDEPTGSDLSEKPAIKTTLGLEKGDKYKTITLIGGAITLVVIAVLGTMKSRKEE